jgi:6-pyruvoyltetrahydropterin/6-carboxytetrahydropterin synthase
MDMLYRFESWFKGELDQRNWVWDFGGMKRAKCTQINGMSPKDMDFIIWLLDHTTVIADG